MIFKPKPHFFGFVLFFQNPTFRTNTLDGIPGGIGSNIFKLAGSVILYGIVSVYIFGLIRFFIVGG